MWAMIEKLRMRSMGVGEYGGRPSRSARAGSGVRLRPRAQQRQRVLRLAGDALAGAHLEVEVVTPARAGTPDAAEVVAGSDLLTGLHLRGTDHVHVDVGAVLGLVVEIDV